MDIESIQKDDQKLQEILKPSEERLEQEREQGIDALKEADFSGRESRKLADSWVQLRVKGAEKKLTMEETASAAKIAGAHALLDFSGEGVSKARREARDKWLELQEEMVENGHSDKQAVRNSDMFYAMATLDEYSNPSFLKLCEEHRELRGLFERNEGLAEELHDGGKSQNEMRVALNEDRMNRAREVWNNKELRKVLTANGYTWKLIEAMIKVRELSEYATEAALRHGDMGRVEKLKKNAVENADEPAKMANGVQGIMQGADYLTDMERSRMAQSMAIISDLMAAALAAGALGAGSAGPTEMVGADEQISFIFDESLQNELLAQDDTQNLASMNAMIEELIDADKEKGEASGEAPTVADLDEETQDNLEKFGVSEDATLKDAIEFMKKARESMQESLEAVSEIRSEDYFEKRGEDVAENVKIPPFYKQETALEIIEEGKREGGVISEKPAQFTALAAIEFVGDGSARTGTLDELKGEYDFANPTSPEAVVLGALQNLQDGEAQEAMKSVLSNPVNVDVRAALLEAFARAKEELESQMARR